MSSKSLTFGCVFAALLWLGVVDRCQAQRWRWLSRETERALQPGSPLPYDGMGFTQRYSYGPQSFFPNSGRTRYLEYLDRADRARKFGYRMPTLPPGFPRSWADHSHPTIYIRMVPPSYP